jgi:chemotaxis protein methyltransferase CheR
MTAISSALGSAAAPSASGMQQLIQIRDLIYRVAGIFHADNKLRLMEDRCHKRMTALGVSNLRDYYDCLTIKPIRQAELVSLLNEITIGETCFFRNRPQIDAIRKIVLPKLIEAKNKLELQKLRIWSAGCSTGEEPYTLSMLLMEEAQGPLKGWIIEIRGSQRAFRRPRQSRQLWRLQHP